MVSNRSYLINSITNNVVSRFDGAKVRYVFELCKSSAEINFAHIQNCHIHRFSDNLHRSKISHAFALTPSHLRSELDSRPFLNGEESSSIRVHYGLIAKL